MNLDLLKKHINSSLEVIDVPTLQPDGSNATDFFTADVVGNKRFAQNFGGYPRSEIAEINDAVSLEVQKSLLNQIDDYRHVADGQNAGLSDVELAMSHRSKYCQAPSEQQDWLVEQMQIRDAKLAVMRAEAEKVRTAQPNVKSPDKIITSEPE